MKHLLSPGSLVLAVLSLGAAAPVVPALQQRVQATRIGVETVPVGSIVAWHVDLPGTPALPDRWMPCDGQLVTDPDSPYLGETLPDLNGEARYLRGGMFSGMMQDDSTAANGLAATAGPAGNHSHSMGSAGAHSHSRTNVGGIGGTRGFAAAGDQSGTTSTNTAGNHTHSIGTAGEHTHAVSLTGDAETRPITMTVVWIMRIK